MANILIMDDEEPIRSIVRQMLERAGHTVREAADGAEGVALFRTSRPDLVITDILMPNKGGLLAIKEIRQLDPGAKILAISGGGKDGRLNFLSTARTFEGLETLRKPFTRAELLAAVNGLLGG